MDDKDARLELADNPGQHRFEARMGGELAAVAEYRLQGDTITFTHTQVEPQHEGQGVGSKLARHALEQARSRKLKVVPRCRFIASYIERHKEYEALLAG